MKSLKIIRYLCYLPYIFEILTIAPKYFKLYSLSFVPEPLPGATTTITENGEML